MSDENTRVEAIFRAALSRPEEERSAFLDTACGGDAALRQLVEDLLRGHAAAGDFLEHSAQSGGPPHFPRCAEEAAAAAVRAQHLAQFQQTTRTPPPASAPLSRPQRPQRRWIAAAFLLMLATLAAGVVAVMLRNPFADLSAPIERPEGSGGPKEPRPSPLDGWTRQAISRGLLTAVGDGDPEQATSYLTAVLGEERFQATGKDRFPVRGHTGQVLSVAVSPDERLLLSGGADRTVRMWDLTTGKEVWHAVQIGPVDSVCFSPDGNLIAAGSAGVIVLWALAGAAGSGQPPTQLNRLAGHSHKPTRLAFARNGRMLAAGGEDGRIHLWEVPIGRERPSLHWHTGDVRAVVFSPDGKLVASAGADGTVCCGAWATGARVHDFKVGTAVRDVAFNADSRQIACVCDLPDGSLRLWDLAGKEEHILARHASQPHSLSTGADSHLFATTAADGLVRLWHRGSGNVISVLTLPTAAAGEPIQHASLTRTGRYLAVAGNRGLISILRVPASVPPARLPGPKHPLPDAVALAEKPSPADALERMKIPDELLTKAGGGDAAKAPPDLVAILGGEQGHTGQVHAVVLSPDGKTLASGGDDGKLRLWDLATGTLLRTFSGHTATVRALAFTADGRTLASGSNDATVRFWNVGTGAELACWLGHKSHVTRLALRPDGQTLAAAAADGIIRLWDMKRNKPMPSFHPARNTTRTGGLAFLADGKVLASGAEDSVVRLWDVETGWELDRLEGHKSRVLGLDLRPDGRILASASRDRTIRCWDLATGRTTLSLTGHGLAVQTVAWHPAGRLLASGSLDGTVRLHDAQSLPPRSRIIPLFAVGKAGIYRVAFTQEGRHLITANSDGTVYVLRLAKRGEAIPLP